MKKSQYIFVKKYKKKRKGFITLKNITLFTVIIAMFVSIGYSYWNTSLRIIGTVTAVKIPSGNGGTWTDPYLDDTTSVYDPSTVTAGATQYNNVAGKPKVEADANGKITRFEYMDTGSGLAVPTGGVDTGVLAFDGNDYDIILNGTYSYYSAALSPVIVMSSRVGSTVEGLVVFNSKNNQKYTKVNGTKVTNKTDIDRFRMIRYNGGTLTNPNNLSVLNGTGNVDQKTIGYTSSDAPITFTLKVMSRSNKITAELYDASNNLIGNLPSNYQYDFSTSNLNDITIELGYWENNAGTTYSCAFTINSFSIQKI